MAWWSSLYHFPEYRARTLEIKPRVSTVTASSSFPEPIVRAFSALKSRFGAILPRRFCDSAQATRSCVCKSMPLTAEKNPKFGSDQRTPMSQATTVVGGMSIARIFAGLRRKQKTRSNRKYSEKKNKKRSQETDGQKITQHGHDDSQLLLLTTEKSGEPATVISLSTLLAYVRRHLD